MSDDEQAMYTSTGYYNPEALGKTITVGPGGRRGTRMTWNKDLLPMLASHDIKRSRALATIDGATAYARKNPKRRFAKFGDINKDNVPDVLVYYDANGDGKFEDEEVTHVNGYYLGKTRWPYDVRYMAERRANPKLFKDAEMGMPQYVEAMHPNFSRDWNTGKVTYDAENEDLQAFDEEVLERGGTVRHPRNASPFQLWKQHVFDPVYYAFVTGVKANDGSEEELKLEQAFRYIVMSGKCYKSLISLPILRGKTGRDDPERTTTEAEEKELRRIKASAAYKLATHNIIYEHIENRNHGWHLVANFIQYVFDRLGLKHKYTPNALTNERIDTMYEQRHDAAYTKINKRQEAYKNLTYAKDLRWNEDVQDRWANDIKEQKKLPYWDDKNFNSKGLYNDIYGMVPKNEWKTAHTNYWEKKRDALIKEEQAKYLALRGKHSEAANAKKEAGAFHRQARKVVQQNPSVNKRPPPPDIKDDLQQAGVPADKVNASAAADSGGGRAGGDFIINTKDSGPIVVTNAESARTLRKHFGDAVDWQTANAIRAKTKFPETFNYNKIPWNDTTNAFERWLFDNVSNGDTADAVDARRTAAKEIMRAFNKP
jgi:hypothetical protein